MIVRVLRPVTGSKGRAGTPGEETAPKLEPLVDEAADANAIEVCYILLTYTIPNYLKAGKL